MIDLEHPDVTAAQLTGYPRRHTRVYVPNCTMCGEPISSAEWYFPYGDELICSNCIDDHKCSAEDAYIDMD